MANPLKADFTQISNFVKNDKQLLAYRTLFSPECKYLLYGGAAGGGKSYFLRWAGVALGLYYSQKYGINGVPIGLFSSNYPSLKDRQIIKMKREFPSWLGTIKESRDEGYIFQAWPRWGGWKIMLRNLDDPSKYKSVEFAAILVEELTENVKSTFDDLRFRLRFPGIPDPRFVAATNPGSIGHAWVKRLWVTPDQDNPDPEQNLFKYVPALFKDNVFLDASYEKQLDSLSPEKMRAYKEGDWDLFAGQYFDEFRRFLHTTESFEPMGSLPKFAGIDWGRTAAFVFLGAALQVVNYEGEEFNRLWIYKEISGVNKNPKDWAEMILGSVNINEYIKVMGDPSMFIKQNDGSESIADQFKGAGLTIKPANNNRLNGWAQIHKWLSVAPDGLPYLLISENCRKLVETLPELVHDENNVEDVDTLGEDHWGDALRYLCMHIKFVDAGGVKRRSAKKQKPAFRDFIDLSDFEQIEKVKIKRPALVVK